MIDLEKGSLCCPNPGHGLSTLDFIEICESDETERKTSWSCPQCGIIVYIVEFENQ